MSMIQKWGNSLGVRLPKAFVEQLGLQDGADVDLTVRDGEIVIAPAQPRYRLAELLAGCTAENRPEPIDWGPDVGREIL